MYPNYYCSKFLKCFHEQKASFIAIFLFSCLQYMYYLFVQYYFQTINCIKAFCRKEKLIQLSFMLGSCQTVFFNIKSNGLWLIFQFLADCSNIRWFSGWKKNVLRFNYMYYIYSTQIDTLSEKWNDCYRLCRHGYFCIFWGRKGVGWFLNQQYPFLHFLITHNSCVVFEFLWWASTFQKCTFFGF